MSFRPGDWFGPAPAPGAQRVADRLLPPGAGWCPA